MNIHYSQDKNIPAKTLLDFFTEAGSPDAKYGDDLVRAVTNSDTVITAWDKDNNKLAALITALDDGSLSAYVRLMTVAPAYRGKGINDELLKQIQEIYKDYPFVYSIAPDDFHAGFFTKAGFKLMENAKVVATR